MVNLDDIILRARDANQRINELFSEEKEVEKHESAELQKIKKLRKDIKDERSEDAQKDFVEALNTFEIISEELDQTSKDLEKIALELRSNSEDELEIVEGLSSGELEIRESFKIEEFTEALNKTSTNTEKVIKEVKELKKEVKQAQKEANQLTQVLNNIKSIDDPENKLEDTLNLLEEVEEDVENILSIVNRLKQSESQASNEIEENSEMEISRRGVGAFSVAALLGLSGCMTPEARKMWGVDESGSPAKKIWSLDKIGSDSEVKNMYEIEDKGSEYGMTPFVRSDKAKSIDLTGKPEKIMDLVSDADEYTREALQIHNSHSTEGLPTGKEIKQMKKLFHSAIEHYRDAEVFAEQKDLKKAETEINYLEKINKLYYEGVDNLQMSWSSTREGAHEDAKEKLEKYQEKFLKAIEELEENGHVSEYRFKQALTKN